VPLFLLPFYPAIFRPDTFRGDSSVVPFALPPMSNVKTLLLTKQKTLLNPLTTKHLIHHHAHVPWETQFKRRPHLHKNMETICQKLGINSFRFDFRWHGESTPTNTSNDFTIKQGTQDILETIQFLQSQG